ncbi:porin family protein [Pseudolabrys sp. Root1462]|uniref:outer membrane protein n=1 Tax=Pseudolabrys sp. Root1462 TaxID=1736466 RepID=UPI0012E36AD2|nr:porin family protein [Pseudolabrys sp. Root1462]
MTYPHYDNALRRRGQGVALRALLLGAAVATFAAPPFAARAADWPGESPLRGSFEPPALAGSGIRWDGINFGGQFGVGNMITNFGSSNSEQVAYDFRNTTVLNEYHPENWSTLPSSVTNGRTYGGFLGYSAQWEGVILGADITYNKTTGFDQSEADSIGRQFNTSDGYNNNVTIDSQATVRLKDYATFRARAGYPMGQFMPYAFAGVAVGRFDYAVSTRIRASGTDVGGGGGSPYSSDHTYTDSKQNAFSAGFAGGVGLDVALTPNVFLRAEWEYLTFGAINGIRNSLNNGRVGVGMRF